MLYYNMNTLFFLATETIMPLALTFRSKQSPFMPTVMFPNAT